MASAQQEVVQGTFEMLKGTGTTNGSDLWSILLACSAEIYPFVPVNDSLANVDAYAIDMIDPAIPSTWNGFIASDFTTTGVTGGAGKYLAMKRAPSNFGQNDIGFDTYSRSGGAGFGSNIAIGTTTTDINSSGATMYISNNFGFYSANTPASAGNNGDGLGLHSINRVNSSQLSAYKRGVHVNTKSGTSETPTSNKFYGFANNSNGTSERNIIFEQAMLCARCSFTTNQLVDWNDVWEYYQTNIITGGRNV
jgi:hypothetical protein